MSNGLKKDQDLLYIGPGLGPNRCKGYQPTILVGKELTFSVFRLCIGLICEQPYLGSQPVVC